MAEIKESLRLKLSKLLELAERGATEEERQLALAKADAIMLTNAIDRSMLVASKDTKRTGIKKIEWDIPVSDFDGDLSRIMPVVAEACRTQYAMIAYQRFALVGHEDDLMYADLLWATIHREFAGAINPSWSASRTFDQNVTLLKEAGFKWVEIARTAIANGHPGSTENGAWLKNAYKRQCAREGREPTRQTQRHAAYRVSFARAFASTVIIRLRERTQQTVEDMESTGTGVELALRDEKDLVEEEFYKFYPQFSPAAKKARKAELDLRMARYEEEEQQRHKEFDALPEAEKERFRRQAAREEAASERRWRGDMHRRRADEAGTRNGQETAQKIDLGVGTNRISGKRELE